MEEYKHFDTSGGARIHLAYPVENTPGVTGLGTLSCGEATVIRLGLRNTSKKAVGYKSEVRSERLSLRISTQYMQDRVAGSGNSEKECWAFISH
jgi:hypothetical protein